MNGGDFLAFLKGSWGRQVNENSIRALVLQMEKAGFRKDHG